MTRTVVIGGGIAGLATAALLAAEGHEVVLVEKGPAVGGRAGLWERDGFRFDTGPSWYLMPEVFDHFFRLLGTTAADQLALTRLTPGYRVFFEARDHAVDVVSGRAHATELFDSLEPGSGQHLGRYLDSAADTYRMALDHFLYTTFADIRPLVTAPVVRRLGRLARQLAQPLDSFAGGFVTDPRLKQILGFPAVFLGASPYRTPALYHLMSHLDLDDGVWYPQGGIYRVIESIAKLARAKGATIHTGTSAVRILTRTARRGDRVSGVAVVDPGGRQTVLPADVVVSAADLHHTETALLPPRLRTYPQRWWQHRSPGPGAVLAYLGVEGRLPQLTHHNLLFTRDWRANFGAIFGRRTAVPRPASSYVCMPSATDSTVAPANHENLFVLVPVPADPGIGTGGEDGRGAEEVEAVTDDALAQIADFARIPDLRARVVLRKTVGPADFAQTLHSWSGGALGPAHTLRQSAFFRAGNISKRVGGLYYAGGSTIPGIGLPMCLISAELVVKRLRGVTDTHPLAEPLRA